MSRIAKYPVVIPDKVEVTIGNAELTVKGPLGTLKHSIGSNVVVKKDGDKVTFAATDDSRDRHAKPAIRRRCLGQGVAGIRTPAIIRREQVETGRYKAART